MKKNIFLSLIILFVVAISAIMLLLFNKDKHLYGTFEYINESGEKSVIIIEKDRLYMENVDYESCEKSCARSIYNRRMNESDVEKEDYDMAEKEAEIEKIEDGLDYKSVFDKKYNSYRLEEWDDLKDEYVCHVSDGNEDNELTVSVNITEETCCILEIGLKEFKYIG
ncbi:MAG: hypothetical protein J6A58_05620 [Oscillospiraceae bacterium]|nr:hypothetical protein [Oscillospiraceae bacterium]